MHTERGSGVEEFLRFFGDAGLAPTRLVFCHVDKRPDPGFHREIAASGAMLEYDTFFRPKYAPEKNVWPLLEGMVAAGLGRQIALATDMAGAAMWRFGGGPGPAAFVKSIKSRLETWPVADALVADLLGRNIARRLAIDPDREKSV
jgi:phosphotriesterase-related protein